MKTGLSYKRGIYRNRHTKRIVKLLGLNKEGKAIFEYEDNKSLSVECFNWFNEHFEILVDTDELEGK